MDSVTQDLLLQKLEELVIDEDRIVTVISASDLLKVTIKDASKLLQTFAEDQKQTKKSVALTYVISGVLKDGDLGVRLVKEEDVKEKEQLFKTVSSKIIYSVQKNGSTDLHTVVSVNGFDTAAVKDDPALGSLKGKNCVQRQVKVKHLPKPEVKPVIKGKSSFFIKPASSGSVENKKVEEPKNEVKQIPKSKPNGGIASFFNKVSTKPVAHEKLPSTSKKNSEVNPSEGNETSENKEAMNGTEITSEEAMDVENRTDTLVSDEPEESSSAKIKTPEKTSSKNKRQRSATKKSDKPSKRRKRIKEVIKSDSDSDDMFADNNEEKHEDINNSDDEQPVVKPVTEVLPPVKNKRRKLVDKTYEDEEGFIITNKEWVYESASEDEKEQKEPANQEKQTAAPPPTKAKKEVSPPVTQNNKGKKGKKNAVANQPTLMNFFKKA